MGKNPSILCSMGIYQELELIFLFVCMFSIKGCDASILITGASAERNALPNLGLRGFEVIDDAKT